MARLTLKAADFRDPQHWRWVLSTESGTFLGDRLRYTYIVGDPGDCGSGGHFNLAIYLTRTSASPETALARFAPTPPLPRDFNYLCELVEQVEGVHFRELFDRLPQERAATGDEALQVVLALANEAPQKQNPGATAPEP